MLIPQYAVYLPRVDDGVGIRGGLEPANASLDTGDFRQIVHYTI